MIPDMRVVLGFRAHSGWAAMVAVAGGAGSPRVLERRRIVIAEAETEAARFPYHAAAELPVEEASALIERAFNSACALAAEAIASAVKRLGAEKHTVTGCVVLTGSGKPLPELAKILAAHPLIHTAEGVMFREALINGARQLGLSTGTVPEKSVDAAVLEEIAGLGKLIGPPWTQDQKLATVAALLWKTG